MLFGRLLYSARVYTVQYMLCTTAHEGDQWVSMTMRELFPTDAVCRNVEANRT